MLSLIYFPCRAVSFFCPLPTPMPCFADMSGFWLGLVLIYALYCGLYLCLIAFLKVDVFLFVELKVCFLHIFLLHKTFE